MFHIVLHEPEIPQNTGNIVRTCKATGSVLHLIEPMGFAIDDRKLKRAGLDYWHGMDIRIHKNFEAFLAANPAARLWLLTTKGAAAYHTAGFKAGDCLLFGKETAGLPEELLYANRGACVRIPMIPGARSLNLSNSVAVVAYEAMRQQDFAGMRIQGALTGRAEPEQPWLHML